MRRLAVVVAAVTLAGIGLLARPPAASACSCVAPEAGAPSPEAIVRGVAGELVDGTGGRPDPDGVAQPTSSMSAWRFDVEDVERGGMSSGDRIEVHITEGDEAGCGASVGPVEAGRRYRVGGSFDESTDRLHLNLCTDPLLEPLGDAPGDGEAGPAELGNPTDSTAVAVLDEPGGGGGLDARIVGAGVAAMAGAGAGVLALRRRLG